jgi:hypothetical protein
MSKAVGFVAVGNVRMQKKGFTLVGQFDNYSLFSDTNTCYTIFSTLLSFHIFCISVDSAQSLSSINGVVKGSPECALW